MWKERCYLLKMVLLLASSCFVVNCLAFDGGKDSALGGEIRNQGIEKRVIEFVNGARLKGMKCGNTYYEATKPVLWNDKLSQASLLHSLDMAEKIF